jgi:hypothetical protein
MSDKFGHHKAGSPSVPCRVHGGRTITVTVIEKHSQQPLKGARVALTPPAGAAVPATHTTGANGVATFDNLATGRYTAQATHPGWWFVEEGERLAGGDHLHLLAFEKKVRWGIDSNLGDIQDTSGTQIINLDTFHAQKKSFLGRYLSLDPQSHPQLDDHESPRYKGIDVFAIWEKTKYRAIELGTHDAEWTAGRRDAHHAVAQLKIAKAPPGCVIYFTADFTPKRKLLTLDLKLIDAYFDGVLSVIKNPDRLGAYGTFDSLTNLLDSGRIKDAWQMVFGKKGDEIDDRVRMYQYDIWPSTAGWGVAGSGALDLDCAVHEDFGQFRF